MGQYYEIYLKSAAKGTKRYEPIEYDGNKLMEFSWLGSNIAKQICSELLVEPKRVYVIGDYASNEDDKNPNHRIDRLLELVPSIEELKTTEITKYKNPRFELDQQYYVVNITKNLYYEINPEEVFKLFLLCSIGNGYGGGDYMGVAEEEVGTWYGDMIQIVSKDNLDTKHCHEYTVEFDEY